MRDDACDQVIRLLYSILYADIPKMIRLTVCARSDFIKRYLFCVQDFVGSFLSSSHSFVSVVMLLVELKLRIYLKQTLYAPKTATIRLRMVWKFVILNHKLLYSIRFRSFTSPLAVLCTVWKPLFISAYCSWSHLSGTQSGENNIEIN